jgi:hypothetical protein
MPRLRPARKADLVLMVTPRCIGEAQVGSAKREEIEDVMDRRIAP